MTIRDEILQRVGIFVLGICMVLQMGGCGTVASSVSAGVAGVTAVGAHSPNNEIEQIYYLGIFDPQEQVPPSVYRVRVHGQASAISKTRFSSGWVRADLIDSLGTQVTHNADGEIEFKRHESSDDALKLFSGRRQVVFGPEGFREVPKDHRLVIVMGSSPQDYFQAVDSVLGEVAQVVAERRESTLNGYLFKALAKTKAENGRLKELERDIEVDVPGLKEASK